MAELTQTADTFKMQKGVSLLGLALSESELNELWLGNYISLEGRSLSEIGSLFILAAALSAINSGKTKKTVTFQDLLKVVTESARCPGIPIYCWCDCFGKRCLYLTLVDGKPAILTNCES